MIPICYVISKAIILGLNQLHNQNTCNLYNCTFVLCKIKSILHSFGFKSLTREDGRGGFSLMWKNT